MHENKDYLKVEYIKRQVALDLGCLLSDSYGFCNRHNFGKKKKKVDFQLFQVTDVFFFGVALKICTDCFLTF